MTSRADRGSSEGIPVPGALRAASGLVVAGVSWWNRSAVAGLVRAADRNPIFLPDVDVRAVETAAREGRTLLAWAAKLDAGEVKACHDRSVPLVRIEDGFLRSVGLGAGLVSGASYALDTRGIHYDATAPSDLEHLLEHEPVPPGDAARGGQIRQLIVASRLSKYNLSGRKVALPAAAGRERVLVPGQVAADAAVRKTLSRTVDLAADNVNLELLRAVRRRNPDAFIVFKPHPDVAKGLRPGAVPAAQAAGLVDLDAAGADILALIAACDRIETLSSLAGFEALLRGKPVTVHGLPFYAGWGLTEDLTRVARRSRRRTIDELAFLALARYCSHVDPVTHEPVDCERLIERLARLSASRRQRAAATVRTGISWLGRRLGL